MFGEGVYDVPALKPARLAIAQGPGTKMASSVADVVLVRGDLAAVPAMVAEGAEDRTSIRHATYELQEIGHQTLEDVLEPLIRLERAELVHA
jgi:hypothetical protein